MQNENEWKFFLYIFSNIYFFYENWKWKWIKGQECPMIIINKRQECQLTINKMTRVSEKGQECPMKMKKARVPNNNEKWQECQKYNTPN